MDTIVSQAFGAISPVGTTNIGKEQAAAAIAGIDELKTYSAGGQNGSINPTAFLRAPKGSNLTGVLNFTPTLDVVKKIKIIVDTRNNTENVRLVLFDNLNLHQNDCMAGCPGGAGGSGIDQTKIYLQNDGNECGYESFRNEICSRTYLFSSMKFKPRAFDGAALQLNVPIHVSHKNILGSVIAEDRFSTDDHETTVQTRNFFNVPLMGESQVLSKYTAWTLDVEPNHLFELEFTVAAAGLVL